MSPSSVEEGDIGNNLTENEAASITNNMQPPTNNTISVNNNNATSTNIAASFINAPTMSGGFNSTAIAAAASAAAAQINLGDNNNNLVDASAIPMAMAAGGTDMPVADIAALPPPTLPPMATHWQCTNCNSILCPRGIVPIDDLPLQASRRWVGLPIAIPLWATASTC